MSLQLMCDHIGLFEGTAKEFAASIDATIDRGAYARGSVIGALAGRLLRPSARVLDYGCGPGRLAAMLAEMGFLVHGVDPSPAMLDEARMYAQKRGNLQIKFDLINETADEQAVAPYDAVLCSSVIEYVADVDVFLARLRRLLVPNGMLILTFANRRSLWRKYADLRFRDKQPHRAIQHNIWTWKECRRVLQRGHFEVISAPQYFESVCDFVPYCRALSQSVFMGTLGVVGARKRA